MTKLLWKSGLMDPYRSINEKHLQHLSQKININ